MHTFRKAQENCPSNYLPSLNSPRRTYVPFKCSKSNNVTVVETFFLNETLVGGGLALGLSIKVNYKKGTKEVIEQCNYRKHRPRYLFMS